MIRTVINRILQCKLNYHSEIPFNMLLTLININIDFIPSIIYFFCLNICS